MEDKNSGKHQPFEWDPTKEREMPIIKREMLTEKQLKYLESLVVDLQFDLHRRNVHIKSIIFREIAHLDELTKREASAVIDRFKEWRDSNKVTDPSENQE